MSTVEQRIESLESRLSEENIKKLVADEVALQMKVRAKKEKDSSDVIRARDRDSAMRNSVK